MKNSKIILINKKSGISSFKAIRDIQKKYKFSKIGHAGTLDPLAEGLLIAMSGKATKLSDLLMKKDKQYLVRMMLGFETDTLDLEGKVIKTSYKNQVTLSDLKTAINKFIGKIEQEPPIYSAIKVGGNKLYNLARKNIEVDIPKRIVEIYDIFDIKILENNIIEFRTIVSSGTYIRSLVRDIAYELNTYATMSYLKREAIYKFVLPEKEKILDINEVIELDNINLSYQEYYKIKNGQTIIKKDIKKSSIKKLHAYLDNKYLGIVDIIKIEEDSIYIKRSSFFESEDINEKN